MNCALFPDAKEKRSFRFALLRWYDREKRELPWRSDKDPYRIWVSEIMLQQTRVGAVLEHYRQFLQRFPTVSALSAAKTDAVLAAWSGLGYYRRARNLHAGAQKVVAEMGGKIPTTAAGLRSLPGIGRYTASAIASIAFGEPSAVLDGNVERVLQRLSGRTGTKKADLWTLAEDLLSRERPGDFNQAMMELGATVCVPGDPRCLVCPIKRWCQTKGSLPKTKPVSRISKHLDLALIRKDDSVKLVQRSQSESVMAGMWELPILNATPDSGLSPTIILKHAIMNTDYQVRVWSFSPSRRHRGRWWTKAELSNLPLTGLARKILRRVPFV